MKVLYSSYVIATDKFNLVRYGILLFSTKKFGKSLSIRHRLRIFDVYDWHVALDTIQAQWQNNKFEHVDAYTQIVC